MVQADPEVTILPPQPPQCLDYGRAPPHLAATN